MRLDEALVARGLLPNRTRARAAIMAGLVLVDGERVEKAGATVKGGEAIRLKEPPHPWASRGGVKLEAAVAAFGVDVSGAVALDSGSSTGGFTDVLLSRGALRVHAVDVGYGIIDWRLRQDARVVLHERTNLRHVTAGTLGETVDLVTLDLSFIGLEKVLPAVGALLSPAWRAVLCLVKPQFQVGKGQVGKGGIVREPSLHLEALRSALAAGLEEGWHARGSMPSPIRGAEGNVEFWLLFGPDEPLHPVDLEATVRESRRLSN